MIEDPVEILVQMAQRGDIDPWNIDIIQVTDRFFAELDQQQMLDLRVSGRTLFFAATLLRIKSELLAEQEDDEDADPGFFDPDEDDDPAIAGERRRRDPILFLEHEIERRLNRKHLRKQPITLYDLIILLRNAEKEDRRRQRDAWVRDGLVYAEEIVSIAHEETYHDSSEQVFCYCESCFHSSGSLTLSDLASELNLPRLNVYIPLLFLMHEGRLSMRQESFYGEIFIEPMSS